MSDSTPHTAFRAPELFELAPLFPGYEIEMLIATGGMGAVYRAIQKSLDRTVAIKILPREFSSDAAFCSGFEAEAKAMARLNHVNLVGVYDFGEVDGMLYIVMEYVAGKSLYHSSNGNAIHPSEVIRLITGICDGLAHAHEHGILHRDIKPSNILLDSNALPKIGDFGLARPVETKIQEGEEIFGTPHYTAPEVVDAPNSVDHRADIFSVGVLLHELLTGRLPATDPRSASVISHCDSRFDAIIHRATQHNPNSRYGSAIEIAQDLQNIANTASTKVRRMVKPVNRRAIPHPAPTTRHITKPQSSGSSSIFFWIIVLIIGAIIYLVASTNEPFKKRLNKLLPANTSLNPSPPNPTPPPTKNRKSKPDRPPESDKSPEPDSPLTPSPDPKFTPNHGRQFPADNNNNPTEDPAIIQPPTNTNTTNTTDDGGNAEATPKFDVPAFFERARGIMYDRAAPLIANRDNALKKNLTRFDSGANRVLRKSGSNKSERERVNEELESLIKESEENQNRIEAKLHWRLKKHDAIEELYDECCNKQTEIDLALTQSLAQLSPTYTLGLQKQIDRLQNANDPAAIRVIEEEITKTRENETYFPDLMLKQKE